MNTNYYYKDSYKPGEINLRHRPLRRTLVPLFFYSAFIMLAVIIFTSCEEKKQMVAAVNKDVYYTCSMHPRVHEDHPGNCPICGMKLIAVPRTSASETTQIHLSAEQI